jgi:hypothetical protein
LRSSSFKALLLVGAIAGFGCRDTTRPSRAGASVILISIDTLRADRVGAYGSKAGLTPNLDALAREGVVFEETYSHAPLTLPAHASRRATVCATTSVTR